MHIAKGEISQVQQPFASRPLSPLLAGLIAHSSGWSIEHGFLLIGVVSLVLTCALVFALALETEAPRWLLPMLVCVSFWPQLLQYMALPDALYAALLAGMLWCLAKERLYVAAIFLFPLMLARESTTLTLVCFLAVGWRRLGWRGAMLAFASVMSGALVVKHWGAGAAPNPEHLPEWLYLVGKAPWNLARSAGVMPWSNLYPSLCGVPRWQHSLPVGPLRAIGVCDVTTTAPQQVSQALLTTYGLLLTLLIPLWIYRERGNQGQNILVRFCIVYGAISFALAPLLGTWYFRLFGYGWPLFLVALPRLFKRRTSVGRNAFSGRLALLAGALLGHAWIAFLSFQVARYTYPLTVAAFLCFSAVLVLSGREVMTRSKGPFPSRSRGKIKEGNISEQAGIS